MFAYFADLAPVIAASAQVLEAGGILAFTSRPIPATVSSSARSCVTPTAPHMCAQACGRRVLMLVQLREAVHPQRGRRTRPGPCRSGKAFATGLRCDGMLDKPPILPEVFTRWFADRGWTPRAHQLELLAKAQAGRSALLIAPTGAGKTLAGFLPTLVELSATATAAEAPKRNRARLHRPRHRSAAAGCTRSTSRPSRPSRSTSRATSKRPSPRWRLPIRIETRTGDTPASKRQRQRRDPPDILLTTPEQLALLLATADAPYLFATLRRVVLDELHSLVMSKRGDLLSLDLARLFRIAPNLRPSASRRRSPSRKICAAISCRRPATSAQADLVLAEGGAAPHRHNTQHRRTSAMGRPFRAPRARAKSTSGSRRTRPRWCSSTPACQAEMIFQELWRVNDDNLAIALHHGSLDVTQRRKVEGAMAEGRLRAVVCTSSLDLGIDWGDIDLVINVGAPKGSIRLLQRIGRANHRMDEPSRGMLVPANRFEVLECAAAVDAVAENAQDTPPLRTGALDVLAQHILGCACGEPFLADELYEEVRRPRLTPRSTRADFDAAVDFVATGGYALKVYERFAKIRQGKDGRWRITHPRIAQMYRMNVGTIVEADMLKVRLVRSRRKGGESGRSRAAENCSGRWRNISSRR